MSDMDQKISHDLLRVPVLRYGRSGRQVNWLAPGLAAFIIFGLLRLWFFMELNRLSIAREIKRLELQVAVLANTLRSLAGESGAR